MSDALEREPAPSSMEQSVKLYNDRVWLLDRRSFPFDRQWHSYSSAEAVSAAIKDMVTQSAGPLFATTAALEMTALQCRALAPAAARRRVLAAAASLAGARPTNNGPRVAAEAVGHAIAECATTSDVVETAIRVSRELTASFMASSRALGEHTAQRLDGGARILTHCWMDTFLTELVRAGIRQGKRFDWIATETRPYLQGARLTAHTLRELGQPVTLITDGMAAAVLKGSRLGRVDALVTAADRVSMDGSVANKVGTLSHAVAAKAFGVPFYALVRAPDRGTPRGDAIPIEERDPREVLSALGRRTASPLVDDAWYPAFDVTPPDYVSEIITDRGAFAPGRMVEYFAADEGGH